MKSFEIMELQSAYKQNKRFTAPYLVEDTFVEISTFVMSNTHDQAFMILDMSAPKAHQSPTVDEYNQPSFISEMKDMVSRGVDTEIVFINQPTNTLFETEMADHAQQHDNLSIRYADPDLRDMLQIQRRSEDKEHALSVQFAFYDEKAFICGFSQISMDFPRHYSLNDKPEIAAAHEYITLLKRSL